MTKVEVKFKPRIEKDKVVIDTKANEELTFDEYKNACRAHNLEYQRIENSLHTLQAQLKNMDKIEEDEEVKKFAEMMKKTKAYGIQEKLIDDIKNLEELRMKKKKLIDSFKPIFEELEKKK